MAFPIPVPRSRSPYHPGRTADTGSAPFSMAWAAIHTSLVGMGLSLALGIQEGSDRQRDLFSVNYFCRFRQLFLPVHPLFPDCAAGPLRCGSWGRRIPG